MVVLFSTFYPETEFHLRRNFRTSFRVSCIFRVDEIRSRKSRVNLPTFLNYLGLVLKRITAAKHSYSLGHLYSTPVIWVFLVL